VYNSLFQLLGPLVSLLMEQVKQQSPKFSLTRQVTTPQTVVCYLRLNKL
jgi:hypothetical protein